MRGQPVEESQDGVSPLADVEKLVIEGRYGRADLALRRLDALIPGLATQRSAADTETLLLALYGRALLLRQEGAGTQEALAACDVLERAAHEREAELWVATSCATRARFRVDSGDIGGATADLARADAEAGTGDLTSDTGYRLLDALALVYAGLRLHDRADEVRSRIEHSIADRRVLDQAQHWSTWSGELAARAMEPLAGGAPDPQAELMAQAIEIAAKLDGLPEKQVPSTLRRGARGVRALSAAYRGRPSEALRLLGPDAFGTVGDLPLVERQIVSLAAMRAHALVGSLATARSLDDAAAGAAPTTLPNLVLEVCRTRERLWLETYAGGDVIPVLHRMTELLVRLGWRGMDLVADTARQALEHQALRTESRTDALTGVGNRRALDEELRQLLRFGPLPLALILVDIDHFKGVNDVFTHVVGDEVLRRVAASLSLQLRSDDQLLRYGGDEFVVLLPGTGEDEAQAVADRMSAAVADRPWRELAEGLQVSVTTGVAAVWSLSGRRPDADAEKLFRRADERLLDGKRSRPEESRSHNRPVSTATPVSASGDITVVVPGEPTLIRLDAVRAEDGAARDLERAARRSGVSLQKADVMTTDPDLQVSGPAEWTVPDVVVLSGPGAPAGRSHGSSSNGSSANGSSSNGSSSNGFGSSGPNRTGPWSSRVGPARSDSAADPAEDDLFLAGPVPTRTPDAVAAPDQAAANDIAANGTAENDAAVDDPAANNTAADDPAANNTAADGTAAEGSAVDKPPATTGTGGLPNRHRSSDRAADSDPPDRRPRSFDPDPDDDLDVESPIGLSPRPSGRRDARPRAIDVTDDSRRHSAEAAKASLPVRSRREARAANRPEVDPRHETHASRDAAEAESAAREVARAQADDARKRAAREARARDDAARDAEVRARAEHEKAVRDAEVRDRTAREKAAREATRREKAERETAAREQFLREKAAQDKADREIAEAEARRLADLEAAEQARREAAEQARREAAEQARRDAAEQARLEAAEQARVKAAEQARLEATERARAEAERARLETERLAAQARERERLEAEAREQERLAAEAREQAEREAEAREQAEREAEAREQAEREAEAREQERLEALAQEKARLETEARAKARREAEAEAQAKAQREAEAREQERLEALAQEKARLEAEAQAKAEAEAREQAEREAKAREQERLVAEAREQERLEALAREKARLEAEARAKAQREAEAREQERLETLAREKAAREQAAREAAEAEARQRAAREQAEREQAAQRKAAEEAAAAAAAEAAEQARRRAAEQERRRIEQERREAEAREKERLEAAARAAARAERERQESEARARVERERKERERAEAERLAAERREQQRREAEARETERLRLEVRARAEAEARAAAVERARVRAEAEAQRARAADRIREEAYARAAEQARRAATGSFPEYGRNPAHESPAHESPAHESPAYESPAASTGRPLQRRAPLYDASRPPADPPVERRSHPRPGSQPISPAPSAHSGPAGAPGRPGQNNPTPNGATPNGTTPNGTPADAEPEVDPESLQTTMIRTKREPFGPPTRSQAIIDLSARKRPRNPYSN